MTMFTSTKYETLKLFLDQIALAVFGIVTAVASSSSPVFQLIFGIIGIGLYFYILYATMWEIGAKDRIKVDAKREERKPEKPLLMGLVANVPNFILGLVGLLKLINNDTAQTIGSVAVSVSKLLQGYYLGVNKLMGIGEIPYTYLVTALIGVFMVVAGYSVGYKGVPFLIFKNKKQS
ncbi:MAG: hypothetical protein II135_06845 [Clostridia bacterium]|nr:hypothetical protein [Clostridia bacterium]MBQ3870605.1 hypothetical protein [Clostridia bacterium]